MLVSTFMIMAGTIGAGVASVTAMAILIGAGTIGAGVATATAGTDTIDGTTGVGVATTVAGTIGVGVVTVTPMHGVLHTDMAPITETEITPTTLEDAVITITIRLQVITAALHLEVGRI